MVWISTKGTQIPNHQSKPPIRGYLKIDRLDSTCKLLNNNSKTRIKNWTPQGKGSVSWLLFVSPRIGELKVGSACPGALYKRTSGNTEGAGIWGVSLSAMSHIKLSQGASNGGILPSIPGSPCIPSWFPWWSFTIMPKPESRIGPPKSRICIMAFARFTAGSVVREGLRLAAPAPAASDTTTGLRRKTCCRGGGEADFWPRLGSQKTPNK